MRSRRSLLTVLSGTALLTLGMTTPSADGARLLKERVRSADSAKRTCHTKLTRGAGVVQRRVSLGEASVVRATLRRKRGDWDLAVFDSEGRLRAGSAAPRTREVAEGFAPAGELTVQACRRKGRGRSARLKVTARALPKQQDGTRTKVRLVRVSTPDRSDKTRLQSLGLDLTEHAGPGHVEVVAYGQKDLDTLRKAGLDFTIRIADLAAADAADRRADALFARRTKRSSLPSGRDEYRRLADYEAELKTLAEQHPELVKLIVLPHKTHEGRTVTGIEITSNVKQRDGKPVFAQFGLHHAREWPSGEHAIEWAYELINGYGTDARVTRLVDSTRTLVVPVVNPDGFNLSREAQVDLGFLAQVDPYLDPFLIAAQEGESNPITGAGMIAAILFDIETGFYAYKRRNCRLLTEDGQTAAGTCGDRENRTLGTDPNRNYGGFWGGPGASTSPTDDTYRGPGPFSEPEVQNVRELVSERQVTTLITNHTYTNLLLRPPGVKKEGPTPDEPLYKALGDAMAGENGYASQYSYELYDTTGGTEDWTYYATGGLGFTFEIGPEQFHPAYEDVIAEYEGDTAVAKGGNREAYFIAQESTALPERHAVISGKAPVDATLELEKTFDTYTSPVIGSDGSVGDPQKLRDRLTSTMVPAQNGTFEWHVNPSTRPFSMKDRTFVQPAANASQEQDISGPPIPPLTTREIPFTVSPAEAGGQIKALVDLADTDDYDLYLYLNGEQVASGTNGFVGSDEVLVHLDAEPGDYVLEIVNYAATNPYTGSLSVYPRGSAIELPATTESWTLTCKRGSEVLGKRDVQVARGGRVDVGAVCGEQASAPLVDVKDTLGPLQYAYEIDRRRLGRALRRGLRGRVRCSRTCRSKTIITVARKTAKRYKLKRTVVARGRVSGEFDGRETYKIRFKRKARRKLRKARRVEFRFAAATIDVATGERKVTRKRYMLYR